MQTYLTPTPLVDYLHPDIQQLAKSKGWKQLAPIAAAKQIYNFVRDEIAFGYSKNDQQTASQVLTQGYGQCNTKGTLLVALLRACEIPARVHGFKVKQQLKRGLLPAPLRLLAPKTIVHSWVEVWLDQHWVELEGYIIDSAYLKQVQRHYPQQQEFIGFGIATACLHSPDNQFSLTGSYIQKLSICEDLGIFTTPDELYQRHHNLTALSAWAYAYLLRHWLNIRVRAIRRHGPTERQ